MTPFWPAVITGFFAIAGAGFQFFLGNFSKQSERVYQREIAAHADRKSAYLELVTWFALTRDQLRRCIIADEEYKNDLSDAKEQARMDALASIFSTAEFRKCMSEWRWAFEQAAIAHKEYQTFCAAPQVGPDNPKHEEQFIKLRDDRQYRIDAFGEAHKRLCELAAKDVQGVNSSLTLK